ncbi:MAG TPA: bifunctional class I SAM-dependent methyltransferase/glycosyltransferase family 2 protein [Terriglobia bacterium]|nr:bifunctional class I SAM-dependent methyltransferase/glycosyltransferase family 2 protein [Terriglobia bacterium]
MSSIGQTVAGKSVQPYPEWAKQARRDRLPASMEEYFQSWADFFDHYAATVETWRRRNAGYHRALASLARFHVPEGSRVLEVGSGTGDLLAATRPRRGVGIDISGGMVHLAQTKYPDLEFRQMAAEQLDLEGEKFDYILLSDLTGFLFDIRLALERLRAVCRPETRLVMHWYSRAWQPVLVAAEKLGLKYPQPLLNWTTVEDIKNLLHLTDFDVVQTRKHILLPKRIPGLSTLANRYLAPLPLWRHLCLTNWIVARPLNLEVRTAPRVSVICPCRNEAGNIRQIVERLPALGAETELILVEGHSKDDTLAVCRKIAAALPEKNITVLVQEGRGKGDAVRLGFSRARGDILMILDADASVAPEDLAHFYDALLRGKGEFINGCRLVYTMDPKAMRFLNLLGNRLFALLLSTLIGQPIKDSLCGTKVLWRSRYDEIARGRAYFGPFDPFGDFDLLFGAAKLNLRIIEMPIRYRQRTYGATNISRFADGWLLLRMSAKAAAKLFFIA